MRKQTITNIRRVVMVFMVLLILSGVSAFPLVTEVDFMITHMHWFPEFFHSWIRTVYDSVHQTPSIVLYGTDWLAFAHLIIALFFVGVYRDPVRNQFIIQVGIVACLAVFPLALICGPQRNIPFFHQMIDCCFGLLGLIPLLYISKKIKLIENQKAEDPASQPLDKY
jgi:hypothetical protein